MALLDWLLTPPSSRRLSRPFNDGKSWCFLLPHAGVCFDDESGLPPPPFKYIFRWRRVTSPLWMVLIYTLPRNSDEISLALRNGVLTWWDSRVCWHCRRRSKSHVNEETHKLEKSFFFFPPHFLPYKALGWRNSFSLSTCPPLCPQGSCLTAFLNQPNQPASLFLVGDDSSVLSI
jgi:hypothetical protein